MSDINTTVHNYIAAWNETLPEERRAIIAETFADDARYVDPLQSGDGQAGIDAMITGAQTQFPGMRFELSQGPDAHHDVVRFGWELVPAAGGESVAIGFDVAVAGEDGRIGSVIGFLDKAPAA